VMDVAPPPTPTFADVAALFQARCVVCHGGPTSRLDLRNMTVGIATLRQRLMAPLPNNQEGQCPVDTTDAAESGADDAAAEASPSDAGRRPNWMPIVPNDLSQSFLYLKVTGTMPSPGCGARMPRVLLPADGGDGGDAGSVLGPSCSAAPGGAPANCLTAAEVQTISGWILAGAP
jgi:hypothetical protein